MFFLKNTLSWTRFYFSADIYSKEIDISDNNPIRSQLFNYQTHEDLIPEQTSVRVTMHQTKARRSARGVWIKKVVSVTYQFSKK